MSHTIATFHTTVSRSTIPPRIPGVCAQEPSSEGLTGQGGQYRTVLSFEDWMDGAGLREATDHYVAPGR